MPRDNAILFHEKQAFNLAYARIALALPPLVLLVVTCRQVIWHHPWGNPPTSNGNLIFLTVLLILVYLRLTTVRLVTELRRDRLSVAMKGFLRRTRVPVANIRSAEAVEYDPVGEYRGYGVRPGPRGQAYIASGNQAVQLELRDGRKLLIGSQRARELASRIADARRELRTRE
jgi:hypothetical protein